MRIGLYGGSFDPIHIGHLSFAIEMLEAHSLEGVWLCPTHVNPLRRKAPIAPPHHRLAMIHAAIDAITGLRVISDELDRPPPSYTLDTLQGIIAAAERPLELFLLLGADSAATFPQWHKPDEIIKLSKLLVGGRPVKSPLLYSADESPVAIALKTGLTPIRQIEVSSSEIRDRLQRGAHVEHLLPVGVWEYIQQHSPTYSWSSE